MCVHTYIHTITCVYYCMCTCVIFLRFFWAVKFFLLFFDFLLLMRIKIRPTLLISLRSCLYDLLCPTILHFLITRLLLIDLYLCQVLHSSMVQLSYCSCRHNHHHHRNTCSCKFVLSGAGQRLKRTTQQMTHC